MRGQRGSIALENAEILAHEAYAGNQYVLRVHAPSTAERARAGMFVHLQCTSDIALRRPLSIMRTDPAGWIEVLYKPIGAGLAALTKRRPGESLSVLGPIGNGFRIPDGTAHIFALGGGVGIPPMIFAAQQLRSRTDLALTVYMGSEVEFPFSLTATRLSVPGIDPDGGLTVAMLQDWDIACVLASRSKLIGAHDGTVTEIAERTLATLTPAERASSLILGCGPEPMLAATARLARNHGIGCQIALEEYMACAVGGCAGCTVEVHTPEGVAMKRVCVDGPVFDAATIYPAD
jgi:dihydroorotate dehydrogenase electron transfer subunit